MGVYCKLRVPLELEDLLRRHLHHHALCISGHDTDRSVVIPLFTKSTDSLIYVLRREFGSTDPAMVQFTSGSYEFLGRSWRVFNSDNGPDYKDQNRKLPIQLECVEIRLSNGYCRYALIL